jgi:SagB-type dehydrogenase family enzyme
MDVATCRRSIRRHDHAQPITREQLAEFLYRVQGGGFTDVPLESDGGSRRHFYPNAGAVGELEIYPLVARCDGLDPGLYHYDSVKHELARVAPMGAAGEKMLSFARSAAGMPDIPQVLLVITARVQRMMRRYQGNPYMLCVKDSGVLTGWMYLVATAMSLAPCALGAGNAAAFESMSGLDSLVEPSIAEFVLGSRTEIDRLDQ